MMGMFALDQKQIYKIKQRQHSHKIIRFIDHINKISNLTEKEKNILKKYWPGKLSIIKNGIGYRMPHHQGIIALLEQIGDVYCSSANIHGHPPVFSDQEAAKVFAKYDDRIVLVKGKQHDDSASTIIDFDLVRILRVGSVDPHDIMKILRE
ncbi:hypothetical protein FACS1894166_07580 [Bacilli bacterium]|nr:hypothetical protein FACS1894166_07580 [Bacilli bacterium]